MLSALRLPIHNDTSMWVRTGADSLDRWQPNSNSLQTLLQDLGFLALQLDRVTSTTPFKKPRGGSLTDQQKAFKQQLARRRVRIEHVNSSGKRCRIVKDTIRLFKEDIRDMVAEICCALHNFRVRITPWKSMV